MLHQFIQPSYAGNFDPNNVRKLVLNVRMQQTNVVYVASFDRVRFLTPHPALPSPALLACWADRGELRAAIEGWRFHLETRQRGQSDPAVLALIEELRQARYGPRPDRELADLCRRAAGQAGGVVP